MKDPMKVFCSFCGSKAGEPCLSRSGKYTPIHDKRRKKALATIDTDALKATKAVAAQEKPKTGAQRAFGDKLVAEVNDLVSIVKADDYDREKGFEWRLMTTHNGYQFTGTNAIDRRTAALLRDALDKLVKGKEGWL